ncbi:MAG: hypothetical protein HY801_08085 [Candidatus Lindowbacteria bacterium]|nr:hypothetical protein [Candidatus Lindowbacteria bacterium]
MKMFDPKADLFFQDPGIHPPNPADYGVLHLLRRDIYRCLGWDPSTGAKTGHVTLWPGGMAILAGIDLLAKSYEGNDESGPGKIGQRFREFIKKYFQPISSGDAETIYQLRNSLLHSFGLYSRAKGQEYHFALSAHGAPLVQAISDGHYQVDLLTLHAQFEDSVQRYASELNDNSALQEKFLRMFPIYGSVRIE